MTAETLKPFISLPGSTTYKSSSSSTRNSNIIWTCLILALIIAFSSLLGYTVWNAIRLSELEKETNSLKDLIANMQRRLGLDYLDELDKFEEAYSKNLLDNPDSSEGVLLDSYNEDEDDEIDHENNADNIDSSNGNDDDDLDGSGDYDYDEDDYGDNLYDDFGKYKKSKEVKESQENKERKTRSTENSYRTAYGIPIFHESYKKTRNRTGGPDDEEIKTIKQSINSFHYYWNNKFPKSESQDSKEKSSKYLEYRGQPEIIHHLSPQEYQMNLNHNMEKNRIDQQNDYQGYHHLNKNHLTMKNTKGQKRQVVPRSRAIAIHLTLNDSHPNFLDDPLSAEGYDGDIYIGTLQNNSLSPASLLFLDNLFKIDNGIIRVKLEGTYYVYAQVYYNNDIMINGFNIFHNNNPLFQCILDSIERAQTCFTGGIVYLKKDDAIYVRDLRKYSKYSTLEESKSFLGLLRLG